MAVAAAGDLPASPALAGIARTGPADQANGAYLEVAAASPADVWAVGGSSGNRALIVHWNGTAWRRVPCPSPPGGGLSGVVVVSADDAWAVGSYGTGIVQETLIVHWNGTAWRRVPSPDPRPGDDDALSGVAAASVSDIWAVGHAGDKTLIEHWNGEAWQQVPSPSPRPRSETGDALSAVTVASARNAWAVGTKELPSGLAGTLIEHWNGRAWRRVPSPSPPLGCSDDVNYLSSVAVTSARSAWAVGTDGVDCAQSHFERWNGTAWKITLASRSSTTRDLNGKHPQSGKDGERCTSVAPSPLAAAPPPSVQRILDTMTGTWADPSSPTLQNPTRHRSRHSPCAPAGPRRRIARRPSRPASTSERRTFRQ